MIEYYPWSDLVVKETLSSFISSRFSIVDIQLGGGCNFSCVYCDTPDRTIKSNINFKWLDQELSKGGIKWIFICGLGEPTHSDNIGQLKSVLRICQKNGVQCSMFTNLSLIDDEIKEYIRNGVLFILFKLDTLRSRVLAGELYGTKNLDRYFNEVLAIRDLVKINDEKTNIAASIVPTQKNKSELNDVVNYCFDNGIFPLIGNLENSGNSIESYGNLVIEDVKLSEIKKKIEMERNLQYKIPICPSVIGGVHIDYEGKLIVDEDTGLSCHWFWLKEPKIKVLKKNVYDTSFEEIERTIMNYRMDRLPFVKNKLSESNPMVFGGCGGDVKDLLALYLDTMNKIV